MSKISSPKLRRAPLNLISKTVTLWCDVVTRVDLHDRASLPCGCAGGSSASAGDGSVFRRSHTGMASHRCGSTHEHGDEQPGTWKKKPKKNIYITAWIKLFDCRLLSRNVLANPTMNPFWQRTYRHPLYKCQNGLEDVLSCNYGFLCKAENDCTHPWIEVSISAAGPNTIKRKKFNKSARSRCLCKCVVTCTKRAPHVSHLYGFSPEWMRVWVLRLAGRLNWAPQILQRYGFSPESTKKIIRETPSEFKKPK